MVLPKSMRLKGHRCFDQLYREGNRYHEPSMMLRVVNAAPKLHKSKFPNEKQNSCRCAIAISSKVSKKAVVRNRLRRLLHHHQTKRLSNKIENAQLIFSIYIIKKMFDKF